MLSKLRERFGDYDQFTMIKLFLNLGEVETVISKVSAAAASKELLLELEKVVPTTPAFAANPQFRKFVLDLVRQDRMISYERFPTHSNWQVNCSVLVEKMAEQSPIFIDELLGLTTEREQYYDGISVSQRHRSQMITFLQLLKNACVKGGVEYKFIESFRKLVSGRLRRKSALVKTIKEHFNTIPLSGLIPGAPEPQVKKSAVIRVTTPLPTTALFTSSSAPSASAPLTSAPLISTASSSTSAAQETQQQS